jgi:hypothetical protein
MSTAAADSMKGHQKQVEVPCAQQKLQQGHQQCQCKQHGPAGGMGQLMQQVRLHKKQAALLHVSKEEAELQNRRGAIEVHRCSTASCKTVHASKAAAAV